MRFERAACCLALSLMVSAASAEELGWPRKVDTERGKITIYQPQIEAFDGTLLEARTALSITPPDRKSAPVFGAIWIESRFDSDREARLAVMRDLKVTTVRFPDASDEDQKLLAEFLQQQAAGWDLTLSIDRLIADLDGGEVAFSTSGLRHTPPKILLSTEPAVLITLDGEPFLQKMDNISSASVEQVVNTPFLMVRDGGGLYYLSAGGGLWYEARDPLGDWAVSSDIPLHIAALETEPGEVDVEGKDEGPPRVIVSTEPAELVVSDGPPSWSPVEGLDLLYMDNTNSDVFLEIATQSYYTMLSGRWYRAAAVEGVLEWIHVPNDELPLPFADIPEDSPNGSVLAHVTGTLQAREASLDNLIPQTAAIERDQASLEVAYDGEPTFRQVEDVPGVEYAINTATPVFQISTVYFACDQGVWFRAGSPAGPWTVADTVPEALYDIPPSNPHYNVTYVRVYQSTPQVVYVGYTPGYLGSYHYHGCAVWGTGWHYSPWIGTVYVPRQSTWGFRVMWNPWHGWGFGLTWTNGPFALTIGRTSWGRHSSLWFGPVGFRRFPVRPIGVGFRKTNVNVNINKNINVGARPGGGNRPGGGGTRPGGGGLPDRGGNLYDRPQNRDRVADRPMPREGQEPRRARGQDNNVLTDRDGNVYRQDRKGDWQQREGNDWSKAENLDRAKRDGDRPSQQPGSRDRAPGAGQRSREQANSRGSQQWTAPSTGGLGQSSRSRGSSSGGGGSATRPQLERDQRARQRGNQRSGSYGSAGRSGGGRGGGGGGRRR